MPATTADFRVAFPAFKDTIAFPSAQIDFYLSIGYKMHAPDRWGNLLDYGVMLWAAHSLSLDAQGAGVAPGTVRGTVTSMSADGLSWSRDISTAVDPKAGHWNLSTYGLRWRQLVNVVGAGPVYVGAPTLYDSYLTMAGTWTWPGPDFTPW
jgi:hypothetical protein